VETIKTYTMGNRLKTKQDKLNEHYAAMQKQYAKDSISLLNAGIIILTCFIVAGILENL
jgi:hypothetical protein